MTGNDQHERLSAIKMQVKSLFEQSSKKILPHCHVVGRDGFGIG
jgi:hypothetical protein